VLRIAAGSGGCVRFSPSVTAVPGLRADDEHDVPGIGGAGTQDYIREMMPTWKTQFDGVETMTAGGDGLHRETGPGESKAANIGISFAGERARTPRCPVYIDGQKSHDARRHL